MSIRRNRCPGCGAQVADRLTEYRYLQLDAVILLDDADLAEKATVRQLMRFARYDFVARSAVDNYSRRTATTHVQAGPVAAGFGRASHRSGRLAESDTDEFISKSLHRAGCEMPVFDDPAVSQLHAALSGGIPGRLAQLADLALAAGAGRDLPQIDAK